MSNIKKQSCQCDQEELVEVWKILEALTVSLRRFGEFELFKGREAAKTALIQYMSPPMSDRIARARRLVISMLERCDPNYSEQLELLAEDEEDIGYWTGPINHIMEQIAEGLSEKRNP